MPEDVGVRVARIALAPVKGTRHRTLPEVHLSAQGPVGDRRFCLVDVEAGQALRTVAHPSLLAVRARWDGTTLTVDLGDERVSGRPEVLDRSHLVDYWGRQIRAEPVSGDWSAAFSDHLRRPVVLAAVAPGAAVYGGSVSLVTTASLQALTPEGRPGSAAGTGARSELVDSARFRATFVVDTSGDAEDRPGVEASWVGRVLTLGPTAVRVTGSIVRCAVVDLDPRTGRSDARLLRALPRDGRGSPVFGVEAEVVRPGLVSTGAAVSVPAPGAAPP
ncbi:MAG: hypothetical protein JWP95_1214 [Actinotalea sp.]|nr:hypothetical protein [Actinotalea sp.]